MIASFAGGLGLSAMLMPAAPSLALMTFIGALGGTAGRCPDGATGRIVAPAKSRGRNGDLFYVVLCRPGGFDPDRGHSPRRKRSRWGCSNLCWWIGACGIGRFVPISVIATPIRPSVKL